jgi:hypothetical protein
MIEQNAQKQAQNPLLSGGRWGGRVPLIAVMIGGYLGYMLAKHFLIQPYAEQTLAAGRALSWQSIAEDAGMGAIAGMLLVGAVFTTVEQLGEWFRYRRESKSRRQEFINHLGVPEKKQ